VLEVAVLYPHFGEETRAEVRNEPWHLPPHPTNSSAVKLGWWPASTFTSNTSLVTQKRQERGIKPTCLKHLFLRLMVGESLSFQSHSNVI